MMKGIYGVWIDALITTVAILLVKYQIAKAIMDDKARREKNNSDTGNTGNGEINKSSGINSQEQESVGL